MIGDDLTLDEIVLSAEDRGQNTEFPEAWGNLRGLWLPGLSGYRKVVDWSGHGNHGTTAGSMTAADVVPGPNGIPTALDFDGSDDYITISVPFPAGSTVSTWIDFTATSVTGYFIGFDANSGSAGIRYNGSTLLAYTGDAIDTVAWTNANKFVHLTAINQDDNDHDFWINGTFVGTSSVGANAPGTIDRIARRSSAAGGGVPFTGPIAVVLVHDRPLVSSAIGQLYADPTAMLRPRPVQVGWTGAAPAGVAPTGNLAGCLSGPLGGVI